MPSYLPPLCLRCKFLKALPKAIGSSAKCPKYPNGVPKKIFFESGKCSYFKPKK